VYGFLISQSAVHTPKDNLGNLIQNYHNLVEYCNRITVLLFSSQFKPSNDNPQIRCKIKKPIQTLEQKKDDFKKNVILFFSGLLFLIFVSHWNYEYHLSTIKDYGSNEK